MTPEEPPALPECPGGGGGPERWRPVPEYRLLGIPRGYEASSLGRARSVPRTLRDGRAAGGVVLVLQRRRGYLAFKAGRKWVPVHVAVQLAFAGPPEVRHLDGDESNNRPENLAWGSRVENEQDKRRGKEKNGWDGWDRPVLPATPGTGDQP